MTSNQQSALLIYLRYMWICVNFVWLVGWLVRSFVGSFVRSFIRSFVGWLAGLFVCLFKIATQVVGVLGWLRINSELFSV